MNNFRSVKFQFWDYSELELPDIMKSFYIPEPKRKLFFFKYTFTCGRFKNKWSQPKQI